MNIRPEVMPFLIGVIVFDVLLLIVLHLRGVSLTKANRIGTLVAVVLALFFLYFFRDPDRHAPYGRDLIVAGADGTIMSVTNVFENQFLKTEAVRVSIFLSLLDVHVNRAPMAGKVTYLGYFPGKRYFTFQEKSSDVNQHSTIVIENADTKCMVCQIVGPVARRVVYWLKPNQQIAKGNRIGMMKFGSRLDMYFPKDDVIVKAKKGDKVQAGVTVVAVLRNKEQTR